MRIGQDERVTLRQYENLRLSYALNPFQLVKIRNGFEIYQYIDFDKKGNVTTQIKIGFIQFGVKDSWVHLIKTTPFMVHYQYDSVKKY
ncbi:hypothetical protein MCEGE10_02440 [Flavobacteriaceae bacterium]